MTQDGAASAPVRLKWGVKIPLRDGVHLNATLYLPELHVQPSPVIFTLTPYVGQMFHERGLYFAECGYPFLTVDARGRGNSEGVFSPNIQEAQDGYDVVEWLARQPYCDGQVAMWGGSYAGYDQWATAKECPPHLATVVPVASPYVGVDFPFRSNVFTPSLMQWLTLVWGRTSQDKFFWNSEAFWSERFRSWFEAGLPFRQLDTFLGCPSAQFQEWLDHPHATPHWDRYNPTPEQYGRISLPILSITGIYDGDQPGALTHYREHLKYASAEARGRHYLIIGPWDHAGTRTPKAEFAGITCGPESLIDLAQLHRQWYTWTMLGGPKPDFLQKAVAYYVLGAEYWRYADSLEGITAEMKPLYLHSAGGAHQLFQSGTLIDEPRAGPVDKYLYDPRDTSIAEVEASLNHPMCMRPTFPTDHLRDQRVVIANDGKQLVYHSEPFAEDIEISGFLELSAWLSIDQPDTDFRATVYEIDGSGESLLLSSDWIRARYREDFREERLIRTTKPLRYDFKRFTFVSRRVRKGCRLRLVIGPINSIFSEKNYNSGGVVTEESLADARPVTVRLLHDEAHPSALYIPLAQPD